VLLLIRAVVMSPDRNVRDIGATVIICKTRNDIESGKVAYMAFQWGARIGTVVFPLGLRIRIAFCNRRSTTICGACSGPMN
jgi:hypothetical protein